MHRKHLLTLALGGALAWSGPALAADLTVIGWGGASQAAQRGAYFEPLMQSSDIKITEGEYNGEMAKIKAMVETNNVTWDVVEVEGPELVRGCEEGLFERLDWERLGIKDQLIEAAVEPCGAGVFVWSTVLAYNAERLPEGPRSWADFWNVEQFPGKRGMRKGAKFTLEFALLADGVPPGEVYQVLSTPEGVDRAFAKLDEIKPHIQWWEAGAQPPQWLASGDVVMSSAYNGRIAAAQKEGQPLKISWDGMVYALDYWAIVAGSPNRDAAYEFIRFASQADPQAAYSVVIPYGPTNRQAGDKLPEEQRDGMPTAHLDQAVQNDVEFWVDNGEELEERFNVWAAQ